MIAMKQKKLFNIIFLMLFSFSSFAQKANGSVKSLIEVDEKMNYQLFKKGADYAFLKFSDDKTIIFNPAPKLVAEVYKKTKTKAENYQLEWKPEYARISKKGDLGFTSGRFEQIANGKKSYGVYLNVWRNVYDKWKLAYHAKTFQPQLVRETKFDYFEPKNNEYYKLIGPQKIQMRDDIVFSTDELFGKRLSVKNGNSYLSEFYDATVRMYLPGKYPTQGLEESLDFIVKNKLDFKSYPQGVTRAFSGDLAFTYGKASIKDKNYDYVRVWQQEEGTGKWNVIIDMYID